MPVKKRELSIKKISWFEPCVYKAKWYHVVAVPRGNEQKYWWPCQGHCVLTTTGPSTHQPVVSLYFVPRGPYYYKAFALISRGCMPLIRLHLLVLWPRLFLSSSFFPREILSFSATHLLVFASLHARPFFIDLSGYWNRNCSTEAVMVYCIALSSKTVNAIASYFLVSLLFFSFEILYSVVSFSCNTRCGFFSLSPRAAFFSIPHFTCKHM